MFLFYVFNLSVYYTLIFNYLPSLIDRRSKNSELSIRYFFLYILKVIYRFIKTLPFRKTTNITKNKLPLALPRRMWYAQPVISSSLDYQY